MCRILNYEYKSKGGSGSYSSNGVFQNDQLMVGGSDSCQVNIPACGWWIRFMAVEYHLLDVRFLQGAYTRLAVVAVAKKDKLVERQIQ